MWTPRCSTVENGSKTTFAVVNIMLWINVEHPETLTHNPPNKYGAGTIICPAFVDFIRHNRRLECFVAHHVVCSHL